VLDANADKVFRFGEDPGAGNVVKLCGKSVLGKPPA
jgi:3-hydroxyisobutyrate dehydrogenase-like beta-hydroxyacid dehydrogenase